MSLTYTTLKTQIAAYLKRGNLTSYIPSFIQMGENELNRRLHVLQREFVTTIPLVAAASTIELTPSSFFRDVLALWRTDGATSGAGRSYKITPVSIDQFLRVQDGTATGYPRYYMMQGNATTDGKTFIAFDRDADQLYQIGLLERFSFDIVNFGTNWLSTWHEEAYLYAALVQAEPFIKNDKRIIIWRTMLEAVIDQIMEADKFARSNQNITLTSEAAQDLGAGNRYSIYEG